VRSGVLDRYTPKPTPQTKLIGERQAFGVRRPDAALLVFSDRESKRTCTRWQPTKS